MDVYGQSTKFKTQKIRPSWTRLRRLNEGSFKFILMQTNPTPRMEMKCSTFCVHDAATSWQWTLMSIHMHTM